MIEMGIGLIFICLLGSNGYIKRHNSKVLMWAYGGLGFIGHVVFESGLIL